MATNVATIITRTNTDLSQPAPRDMSTDTLNRRNELWVKLLDRLEQFQAKEKGILANRMLTDEGKRQQLTTAADELLTDLRWLGRVIEALEGEQTQREVILFTVEPIVTVKDELLRYHRLRELRDRMAGLTQAERDRAYLAASERSDSETLLAMQEAPGEKWVSPEIQDRADRERAKRTKPDLFDTYTQNGVLHEHLHSMADHIAMMLRGYGTPPEKVSSTLGLVA